VHSHLCPPQDFLARFTKFTWTTRILRRSLPLPQVIFYPRLLHFSDLVTGLVPWGGSSPPLRTSLSGFLGIFYPSILYLGKQSGPRQFLDSLHLSYSVFPSYLLFWSTCLNSAPVFPGAQLIFHGLTLRRPPSCYDFFLPLFHFEMGTPAFSRTSFSMSLLLLRTVILPGHPPNFFFDRFPPLLPPAVALVFPPMVAT